MQDNLKPLDAQPVGYHRGRLCVVFPGTTEFGEVVSDQTSLEHVAGSLKVGSVVELVSEAGRFDALVAVEAIEAAPLRVLFRVLRSHVADPLPEAETKCGGMEIVWRGPDRWSIVARGGEEDRVVSAGYSTERLAAAALASIVGTHKKKTKVAA